VSSPWSLLFRRDSVLRVDVPPPLVTELDIRSIERRGKELPIARHGRGYRIDQVNAFIAKAASSLRARLAENDGFRAGASPGNDGDGGTWVISPRTPAEVDEQRFEIGRSGAGYRMREVDELLDEVTYQLTQLEAENDMLRARSRSEGST
jgi:DivIVA domain-containing protein